MVSFNIPKPNLNFVVPDLGGAVAQAAAIAARREQIEENKRQARQAEALAAARQEANRELQAFEVEKARAKLKQSQAKIDMKAKENDKAVQFQRRSKFIKAMGPVAATARNMVRAVESSPEIKDDLFKQFQSRYQKARGVFSEDEIAQMNLPDILSPEGVIQLVDTETVRHASQTSENDIMADAATKMLSTQLAQDPATAHLASSVLDRRTALDLGFGSKLDEIQSTIQEQSVTKAKASAPKTTINTVPPTGAVKTELQKGLRTTEELQKLMDDITEAKFDPSLFGPVASAADDAASIVVGARDFAFGAPDEPSSLDKRLDEKQKLISMSGFVTTNLLREASGLAMTDNERRFLQAIFGDPQKVPHSRFVAAQKVLKEVLNRRENRDKRFLFEGFQREQEAASGQSVAPVLAPIESMTEEEIRRELGL